MSQKWDFGHSTSHLWPNSLAVGVESEYPVFSTVLWGTNPNSSPWCGSPSSSYLRNFLGSLRFKELKPENSKKGFAGICPPSIGWWKCKLSLVKIETKGIGSCHSEEVRRNLPNIMNPQSNCSSSMTPALSKHIG